MVDRGVQGGKDLRCQTRTLLPVHRRSAFPEKSGRLLAPSAGEDCPIEPGAALRPTTRYERALALRLSISPIR
jgi:hypothetical protein